MLDEKRFQGEKGVQKVRERELKGTALHNEYSQ